MLRRRAVAVGAGLALGLANDNADPSSSTSGQSKQVTDIARIAITHGDGQQHADCCSHQVRAVSPGATSGPRVLLWVDELPEWQSGHHSPCARVMPN